MRITSLLLMLSLSTVNLWAQQSKAMITIGKGGVDRNGNFRTENIHLSGQAAAQFRWQDYAESFDVIIILAGFQQSA